MTGVRWYQQTLGAIDTAAAEGDHATLESLYLTARPLFTDQLCTKLAWAGHLDTLKFLRSLSPPAPLSAMALTLAVQEQQTSTVAWLLSQGCPGDVSMYDACAGLRDWHMLMMLAQHFDMPLTPEQALWWLETASETGNLEIVEWYMENHGLEEALVAMVRDSYWNDATPLERLKRLIFHMQKHWSAAGFWCSAQWLITHVPGDMAFMSACTVAAARQGRLDMLHWLLELPHRPRLTPDVVAAAAENSDPAILKYLRSLKAPWNWRCYVAAIKSGCLGALERLWALGCPLDTSRFHRKISLDSAHHKVLPWIAAHPPGVGQLYPTSCSNGRLIYLAASGWCMPDAIMQRHLCVAQAGFCAYYGAARRLAKQQSVQCTLGSLDNELLQRIACEAGLDFSKMYDDLPSSPEVAAASQSTSMKQSSLFCLADSVIADEDDTDVSICGDEELPDLMDVSEAAAHAAPLTEGPNRYWDRRQVVQLVKRGRAGTVWLACCAAGIDCNNADDSEDEL